MESFEKVAPGTYLREALEEKSASSSSEDNSAQPIPGPAGDDILIVIFSWVQAEKKHIAKYTDEYTKRYPSASILVVRSSAAALFLKPSDKSQQKRLEPASKIINASNCRLFFHAISNGGTIAATQVLMALDGPRRDAILGVVLDCCPGQATYRRTAHAFTATAPKPWRPALATFVYPALAVPAVLSKMGMSNVISRARPRLNDPSLLNCETPRLYIYSQKDAMINWEDVQEHAQDARRRRYLRVYEIRIGTGQHCALGRAPVPTFYWRCIGHHMEKGLRPGAQPLPPQDNRIRRLMWVAPEGNINTTIEQSDDF